MRLSFLLSGYIGRRFLMSIAMVFVLIMAVGFLIDLVNLAQRAGSRDGVGFVVILQMTLLRLPYIAQKVLPFAVLFGTMLTYLWLTRTAFRSGNSCCHHFSSRCCWACSW
jgi:lipopolysaccharide export system permease protein